MSRYSEERFISVEEAAVFDDSPRCVRVSDYRLNGLDGFHEFSGRCRLEYDHESHQWCVVSWNDVEFDGAAIDFAELPGWVQAWAEKQAENEV